jgi:hypothetical protein
MNQGSGLKCLPRFLLGKLLSSQLAQFVINQRQELLGSVRIALLDGGQDLCHLSHDECSRPLTDKRACNWYFPGPDFIENRDESEYARLKWFGFPNRPERIATWQKSKWSPCQPARVF